MTRRNRLIKVHTKQDESAERLLVKMEASGLSAKELLSRGLTTSQQINALQACEQRFAAKHAKAAKG
jgi:hypothetical protein